MEVIRSLLDNERSKYLASRILPMFKQTQVNWEVMLKDDSNRLPFSQFLSDNKFRHLFFCVTSKGLLQCSFDDFAKNKKGVAVYKTQIIHNPEDVKEFIRSLAFIDIPKNPISFMHRMVENVYGPISKSEKNISRFSKPVQDNIVTTMSEIAGNFYVLLGKSQGMTVLTLPPQELLGSENSPARLHAFESQVVQWIEQMRALLNQEFPDNNDSLTPLDEIKFWKKRRTNLEMLSKQLENENIKTVIAALEEQSPPFVAQFNEVSAEVSTSYDLALETSRSLQPIHSYLEQLDTVGAEMDALEEMFQPIFHLLYLMYTKTRYYHSPRHICALLRRISDFFSNQFATTIDGTSIVTGDPQVSLENIERAMTMLDAFNSAYVTFKEKLLNQEGSSSFTLNNQAVMPRFISLYKRMEQLKPIIQTIIEFGRFDKTEVGGIHGAILSPKFTQLIDEFHEVESNLNGLDADLLGISDEEFNKIMKQMNSDFLDLDTRAVAIAIWAIQDVSSIVSLGQILTGFNALLRRPFFIESFQSQYPSIVTLFNSDVDKVSVTYRTGKANPPRLHGIPPTTSNFIWCNGLICRLKALEETLQGSIPEILEDPAMVEALKQMHELMDSIQATSTNKIKEWSEGISGDYKDKLKRPLLARDPDTRLLSLNFDPELLSLLQEVKFLSRNLSDSIPEVAKDIYQNNMVYNDHIHKLSVLIDRYNHPLSTIVDVERPMYQKHIDHIDEILEKGITSLTWEDDGCEAFLDQAVSEVTTFSNLHNESTSNIQTIKTKIESWKAPALFSRTDVKKSLDPNEVNNKLNDRIALITTESQKIQELVQSSVKALTDQPDSPETKQYLDYIESIIIDGLKINIMFSLNALLKDLSVKPPEGNQPQTVVPLITTKLELVGNQVLFSPPLKEGDANLFNTFKEWTQRALELTKLIDPFYEGQEPIFDKISNDEEIGSSITEILNSVEGMAKQCNDFKEENFSRYSIVWTQSRETFINEFLQKGGGPGEPDKDGKPTFKHPELEDFGNQIASYRKSQNDIRLIQDSHSFGWLRVDCRPLKQSLDLNLGKWVYLFTHYLNNNMLNQLNDFQQFLHDAQAGLDVQVKKGDIDQLVAVLEAMLLVRTRSSTYEKLFDQLKATVALLKQHGVTVTDALTQRIDQGPEQWQELKNTWNNVQEKTAPLQQEETGRLRKVVDDFINHLSDLHEEFNNEEFYKWEIGFDKASEDIQKWEEKLDHEQDEAAEIQANGELLDFAVNPFKNLAIMNDDLKLLKHVWDIAHEIETALDKWKNTLWSEIDVAVLSNECENYGKTIRKIEKRAKEWGVYIGLDELIKSVSSTLPIMDQLHNDKLRERHWNALERITGVNFQKRVDLKLNDILQMNLMKYSEDITEIVDGASNEVRMETQLADLSKTWDNMEFEYKPMEAFPDLLILSAPEELIQTLEENQVAVQNYLSSKNISFFKATLMEWQTKLMNVDRVLNVWLDVQSHWNHLRPIFIGSEDIRQQLPKQSESFENIDKQMNEFIQKQQANKNVVDTCNQKDIQKFLEAQLRELTLVEKSLYEYLETKRRAFPRFYFVSSNDLLDILSKGRNPKEIEQHFSKVYDNLVKVRWTGEKTCDAMMSREGEVVEFQEPIELEGAVEHWLDKLLDAAKATLRQKLAEAASSAYDTAQRPMWIVSNIAQIGLSAVCIQWNKEVVAAFKQLEEGIENAMKDYNAKQNKQLEDLIDLIRKGELSPLDRKKVTVICQTDAHNRDVVSRLNHNHEETAECFEWQSQLRFSWSNEDHDCKINIIDAKFFYQYEYLGSPSRLVVTPLTDRCYITLTQSLRRIMGGAPAGPAGTGKTETVKDLARAMGQVCFVFNCSEQMDHQSLAATFKGLSQAGAWGCFDEFNRIAARVLSVVAIQVKSILDAMRANLDEFKFCGEDLIKLKRTCGMFITMNPGYAGRTELPENIKALFRSVSMCVPDFQIICEIMLMSEGFKSASILTKKFTTLYSRCQQLLSKQMHYDWGLRAVKSVLVVAGSLRSADPNMSEEGVLMRALRDFNVPKIITTDLPVFLGLINDLFPSIDVPRKRNLKWEEMIKEVVLSERLQGEDQFIRKVVELEELLNVRHSVFIIGNAGTGKTEVWRALTRAYAKRGTPCSYVDLNPKAVTNNELFGFLNPATRDWQDGLFSTIMRNLSRLTHDNPKWIVLDGDIDPNWIESLNTVMDDNKVLTLASNERIPLTQHMRLIFEIAHLKYATPATVSRAGILYINETDVGYMAYAYSWIERRENATEKNQLTVLFNNYVPHTLEMMHNQNIKHIVPLTDVGMVQTLCRLLEALLIPANIPANAEASLYELYFVFAAVWAFGGACDDSGGRDFRAEFSSMWRSEWRSVVFPQQGTVFDYYVNNEKKKFLPWTELAEPYEYEPGKPVSSTLVFVSETTRLNYLSKQLLEGGHPVMLAGMAGTGKSVLIRNLLNSLNEDTFMSRAISFNYYTTSQELQMFLESAIEMKSGKLYAPPAQRHCIYFIDDINMPQIDTYGTQSPMTLLRQHMDYEHWYDRIQMTLKDVKNVNYVTCMNPTSGSFTINPRLQRHFSTFSLGIPQDASVKSILQQMLDGHVNHFQFPKNVKELTGKIVDTTIAIHKEILKNFMPTAVRFHYIFNMRDLCSVLQSLLRTSPNTAKTPELWARLLATETIRVYADRLIDLNDYQKAKDICVSTCAKNFDGVLDPQIARDELMFTAFPPDGDESSFEDNGYAPMVSQQITSKVINEKLNDYNENHPVMNLVLFKDALEHVVRISRGITMPNGHMLLVGLGGSGKQSLVKLAADLVGYNVFQITLANNYGINEFNADLLKLFMLSGGKKQPTVFLLTDSQVIEEKFLIPISDFLSTGVLPDIFQQEDKEAIYTAVKGDMKVQGIQFSPEEAMKFFTQRVRQYLRVVFCQSPSGDTFRMRARRFPALVNCMIIDWFHPWPDDALYSVAKSFLSDIDLEGNDPETVVQFISMCHSKVIQVSAEYLEAERRYNYATPKSYLELISLFKSMLNKTRKTIEDNTEHFSKGLEMLENSSQGVEEMKKKLEKKTQIVNQKQAECAALIDQISQDTAIVKKESEAAMKEEMKVSKIKTEAEEKQAVASEELKKAQPMKEQALKAIDCIDKKSMTELASFPSPPGKVEPVMEAVVLVLSEGGRAARDLSWKAAKKLMQNTGSFMNKLQHLHENWNNDIMALTKQKVAKWTFKQTDVQNASSAAANIYEWLNNILNYHTIIQGIIPKERAAKEAEELLQESEKKLKSAQAKAQSLADQLQKLKDKLDEAQSAKAAAQNEAQEMADKITRATNLVAGLGDEGERWKQKIADYKEEKTSVVGDVLLAAAFISYAGSFTRAFRQRLLNEIWKPFLQERNVKIAKDPINVVSYDALVAKWNNQGLPNDTVSTENAAITYACQRWPLFIDPQFQAIKWIRKNQEENNLHVLRFGQDNFVNMLTMAVENGESVLIENVGETFDPIIDPLLGRNIVKRGKRMLVQIGDKQVEFNEKFRLFLQTKLANPHFKPEIQAQTTVINFTVTLDGLEEQLLGNVVKHERPGLEEKKAELITRMNDDKIQMKTMEDDLLARLSKKGVNLIEDTDLMNTLDMSKEMSALLTERVAKAEETGKEINSHREAYRAVAGRAALLYFILVDLGKIDHMYQFSLSSFVTVFTRAMDAAEQSTNPMSRENALIFSITHMTFRWAMRGLFQRHQLIFTALICFRILTTEIDSSRGSAPVKMDEFLHLLRCPRSLSMPNPAPEWLTDNCWGAAVGLSALDAFKTLPQDITMRTKPWQKWCDLEAPEQEKLPLDYKNKTDFQKLLVIRALRPDRMISALTTFISNQLGDKFTEDVTFTLQETYSESTPEMALFFILSPGDDPVKRIEALGQQLGFAEANGNLLNVSLGEGQEDNALNFLSKGAKDGGWVIIQNLHLMGSWLNVLEKHIEKLRMGELHETFRIFYTAEPSKDIPAGILQNSIKITSEPARGLKANLRRALALFKDENMEQCQKDREYKALLFHLCCFHSVMVERIKFGPQGFNRVYNFSMADLQICAELLFDNLEQTGPIPWVPLRYLIGEIMYGGHISDDRDRRLCKTYLETFDKDDFEGGELLPGFNAPTGLSTMEEYSQYMEHNFPNESPYLFGLHPNAEIGSLTTQTDFIFNTLLSVQPRTTGGDEGETSMEKSVKKTLDEILTSVPDFFNITELYGRVEKFEPYVSICLQECERMNILMTEIKRSLTELDMGLAGELTISEAMDTLMMSLYVNTVPATWEKLAYASLRPLLPWWKDLLNRHKQLQDWSSELTLPNSVWLPGLFNPSSFLTAVAQSAARKNGWPLDQTVLAVEVTKKQESEIDAPPRDGAYIHGLFLEGARWDQKTNSLNEAYLKELYPPLPVVYVKAVCLDKPQGGRQATYFECPVYVTKQRGPTYVMDFNLKINPNIGTPSHWVKRGVAILLEAN